MTPDRLAILNTPDAFRAWLAAQDPETVVGEPERCTTCPLATFLRANGFPRAQVHVKFWGPGDGETIINHQPWVRRFIREVDQWKCRTAATCLALLEGVE